MKQASFFSKIVLAASFLVGTAAHAAVDPSEHACADLQAALQRDGQLVVQRLFGTTTLYATPQCNFSFEESRAHFEWAKDTHACQLGWDCVRTGN